tara:strand:+ start:10728 stop:11543 length:816 start_codon:yes stop_codon:yes gene_type:complete
MAKGIRSAPAGAKGVSAGVGRPLMARSTRKYPGEISKGVVVPPLTFSRSSAGGGTGMEEFGPGGPGGYAGNIVNPGHNPGGVIDYNPVVPPMLPGTSNKFTQPPVDKFDNKQGGYHIKTGIEFGPGGPGQGYWTGDSPPIGALIPSGKEQFDNPFDPGFEEDPTPPILPDLTDKEDLWVGPGEQTGDFWGTDWFHQPGLPKPWEGPAIKPITDVIDTVPDTWFPGDVEEPGPGYNVPPVHHPTTPNPDPTMVYAPLDSPREKYCPPNDPNC